MATKVYVLISITPDSYPSTRVFETLVPAVLAGIRSLREDFGDQRDWVPDYKDIGAIIEDFVSEGWIHPCNDGNLGVRIEEVELEATA